MFSKSSQNLFINLIDPKDKHFAMEAFEVLGMWTARKHHKIISGLKKKDEQFIIVIIVFIAQTTVSMCSHKSGDLKAVMPTPPLPFPLLMGLITGLLLLYAAHGTHLKLTPFLQTDHD